MFSLNHLRIKLVAERASTRLDPQRVDREVAGILHRRCSAAQRLVDVLCDVCIADDLPTVGFPDKAEEERTTQLSLSIPIAISVLGINFNAHCINREWEEILCQIRTSCARRSPARGQSRLSRRRSDAWRATAQNRPLLVQLS